MDLERNERGRGIDTLLERGLFWGLNERAINCPDCKHSLRDLPRYEHPTAFVVMSRCPECGRLCHTGADAQPALSEAPRFGPWPTVFLGAMAGTIGGLVIVIVIAMFMAIATSGA